MPPSNASAQITLASHGRSASALAGALSGNGLVTLEHARIPGLDPQVFDAAINAGDGGASDDGKLQQVVEHSLSVKPLSVASAQIPFTIKDGRLRVSATALEGDGAQAIVSGGYDIAADQVDVRASLASTSVGSANDRPEVQIFAAGPPDAINPTVDVAALSSWLAVRAIDRETRRLDSIEQSMAPSPAPPPAAPPPAMASLPTEPSHVSAEPLTTDDAPVVHAPVPERDPRQSRGKPGMAIPPPAMASLPTEPSHVSAEPLATDDTPVAHAPVPKRDPRRSRAKSRMAIPPPAMASLPTEPSDVSAEPLMTDDTPVVHAPVPKRDPRRSRAKPRPAIPPRPAVTPQAFNAPTPPWIARLLAPVEKRSAPIPRPARPH
jgi:large subunit ribosomal protein L24